MAIALAVAGLAWAQPASELPAELIPYFNAIPGGPFTYQLSYDDLILGQLPRVNIVDFDDAQFLKEPRLRLLQTSFHVLRRTQDEWARNGLLGQTAQQAASDRPRSYLSELLANARLPRNTLHAHHISQIELAITYARRRSTRSAAPTALRSSPWTRRCCGAISPAWNWARACSWIATTCGCTCRTTRSRRPAGR